MTVPRPPAHHKRLRPPANDNQPPKFRLRAEVRISSELPVTQCEIEVFAALLEDWDSLSANDNVEPDQ